jgi:hypothetical protein
MTDLTIVDNAFESVGSAGEAALDAVVGGAALAVDGAIRPRRSVARARRRGSQVNDTIAGAAEDVAETAAALPEHLLVAFLRSLRQQAARDDVLGAASRTILGAVHGSAGEAARFFARLERETAVLRRAPRAGRTTTTTRGRRTPAARGRTGTAARRTRPAASA